MEAVAIAIVALFSVVNMCGIRWVARLAIPVATASASLAFISALAPILTGDVDWKQAFDYHLTTPFEGWFGDLTAVMAGLYLIGFAAPAFEAAACHVGETIDPNRNVPRAMLASASLASCLARRPRSRGAGTEPRYRPRSHLRAGAGQLRQGRRDLVHRVQHVPRHVAAFGGGVADPITARRRRAPPPFSVLASQGDGLPVGGHRAHGFGLNHLSRRAGSGAPGTSSPRPRNEPSLGPDGTAIRAKVRHGANQGGARSCRSA
jgi:hypothetical protein